MRHVYAGILDEIERLDYEVLHRRAATSLPRKLVLAGACLARLSPAPASADDDRRAQDPLVQFRAAALARPDLAAAFSQHLRRSARSICARSIPARPVVGCVNHTNWWDGFVLYVLSHRLSAARHLSRHGREESASLPVLSPGWASSASTSPRVLRRCRACATRCGYCATDTAQTRAAGLDFRAGEIAAGRRAVEVKPGALFLARRTGAQLLPLVLRYEWLSESRPEHLRASRCAAGAVGVRR